MQIPTRIVFNGVDRSPALEDNIGEHVKTLQIGASVRFSEESGEKGPQASAVFL